MNKENRIEFLLKKFEAKTLSVEEGDELFERIKALKDASDVEYYFYQIWNRQRQPMTNQSLNWDEIEKKYQSEGDQKKRRMVNYRWAAIAASLLVIVVMVTLLRSSQTSTVEYHTGFGTIEKIELEDGTVVILNANSTLTWHSHWKKKNIRSVELNGEAFFQVAPVETTTFGKVTRLPFVVQTPDLAVNVLGTAFNVAYRRGSTDVFLEEGKVALDLKRNQVDSQKSDEVHDPTAMVMVPGDFVQFSSTSQKLKTEKLANEAPIDWKEGTLTFWNVSLGQVLLELEDIYGKSFDVVSADIEKINVSIGLPYGDWETVKNLLELSLNIEMADEENNKIRIRKLERASAN